MTAPSADMIGGSPSSLPSVSGVDGKLGLTMVRTSLQSALDPPPVMKHDARLLWSF